MNRILQFLGFRPKQKGTTMSSPAQPTISETPLQQAISALFAAAGPGLKQLTPDQLNQLIAIQAANQSEHDVIEALKTFAVQFEANVLNNEQRGWYHLPLLPPVPLPPIVESFMASIPALPQPGPLDTFYAGMVEAIRSFVSAELQGPILAQIGQQARAAGVISGPRDSPWGDI